ncbi:hypothetical protein OGAPHI_001028 [Ogataea philodendri]|uniref:Uncharacterized protein n=1 Tax=Ogataea philodendri TaxID=1378263 RepID=A0A9P8PE04_9ASCO|nr:uncharacterized protein OGAPHI_001028 [Ogataea philodendri]KAH3670513.1 hypothetical protein OGAPHI_001028 [Ogataea philodendri]
MEPFVPVESTWKKRSAGNGGEQFIRSLRLALKMGMAELNIVNDNVAVNQLVTVEIADTSQKLRKHLFGELEVRRLSERSKQLELFNEVLVKPVVHLLDLLRKNVGAQMVSLGNIV